MPYPYEKKYEKKIRNYINNKPPTKIIRVQEQK